MEASTRDADALVRQTLLDQVAEANPFAVPPSWVSRMIDAYMQAYSVPDDQKKSFAVEFASVAEQRKTDPGQVYASLQKAGRLPEIERSITEEKVFDWLISRNEITNGSNG